jgi:hypothetical protein
MLFGRCFEKALESYFCGGRFTLGLPPSTSGNVLESADVTENLLKRHPRRKQPCQRCGHGRTIHYGTGPATGKSPCNHPGCQCKDYKPEIK